MTARPPASFTIPFLFCFVSALLFFGSALVVTQRESQTDPNHADGARHPPGVPRSLTGGDGGGGTAVCPGREISRLGAVHLCEEARGDRPPESESDKGEGGGKRLKREWIYRHRRERVKDKSQVGTPLKETHVRANGRTSQQAVCARS